MAKRFKLRLSNVIPSFNSCKSKNPSNLPQLPLPVVFHSKRHSHSHSHVSNEFQWEKDDNYFHVVTTKINDETPTPTPTPRRKIYNASKKTKSKLRFSTSSEDSEWFTDNSETETLVSSSRTLSTETESSSRTLKNPKRRVRRRRRRTPKTYTSECESPARLSVFQRLIPVKVKGKVRESFAVMKKSEEPYEDFKQSMLEMILEKEMFDSGELEQLLHCFLSLNSRLHHGVIVQAFSEIWEVLFCNHTKSSSSPP